MRAARRGRRWVEEWKDESGGKTIWEGKYLAIQLLERGCATHLCCSVCECVCVFSEMIMCGTLGPLKHRICRIWTVKGDRGDEERKEDMSEEK